MKRSYYFIILAVLIIVLIIIKILSRSDSGPAKAATQQAKPVPVDYFIVKDTIVSFPVTSVGTLLPNEKVEVVSEISRRVTSVVVKEGQMVRKGDLLFRLDDAELKANLNRSQAQLELARNTESRQKQLLATGGISQQVYDEALSKMNSLEAEVAYLKVQLDKTLIQAPFSGKTGLRYVSEGALVNPGTVLTTLEDLSRLKLDFSIPERYAASIHPGMILSFLVQGSKETYTARVEATDPSVDVMTRNIKVRAVADKPATPLVPGISVEVALDLTGSMSAIYIPTECLMSSPKGYKVYVSRKGKAELQEVLTDMRSKAMVNVTLGLSPGDTIVATNLLKLKPSTPIHPVNPWRP